jgi:uncharacterized protein
MALLKWILIISWALILCCCSQASNREKPQADSDVERKAMSFLNQLQKEKYKDAIGYFDEVLLNVIPADKLNQIWNQVRSQTGNFDQVEGISTKKENGIDAVYLRCKFEKSILDIKLTFTKNNKIAGFFFLPPS